jgi:hypothetical protein
MSTKLHVLYVQQITFIFMFNYCAVSIGRPARPAVGHPPIVRPAFVLKVRVRSEIGVSRSNNVKLHYQHTISKIESTTGSCKLLKPVNATHFGSFEQIHRK